MVRALKQLWPRTLWPILSLFVPMSLCVASCATTLPTVSNSRCLTDSLYRPSDAVINAATHDDLVWITTHNETFKKLCAQAH